MFQHWYLISLAKICFTGDVVQEDALSYGVKSTCLTSHLVSFNECTAMNISELDGRMLGCLSTLEQQIHN
jgi:hypothetical protein